MFSTSHYRPPARTLTERAFSGEAHRSLSPSEFLQMYHRLSDGTFKAQKPLPTMAGFPYIHLVYSLFDVFERVSEQIQKTEAPLPIEKGHPAYADAMNAYNLGARLCEEELPFVLAHFDGMEQSAVLFRETLRHTVHELHRFVLPFPNSFDESDAYLHQLLHEGKQVHLLSIEDFALKFFEATGLGPEEPKLTLAYESPFLERICDISFEAGQLHHLLLDRFLTLKRSSFEQKQLLDFHAERFQSATETVLFSETPVTPLLGVIRSADAISLLVYEKETFDEFLDTYRKNVETLALRTRHYRNKLKP